MAGGQVGGRCTLSPVYTFVLSVFVQHVYYLFRKEEERRRKSKRKRRRKRRKKGKEKEEKGKEGRRKEGKEGGRGMVKKNSLKIFSSNIVRLYLLSG